MAEASSELRQPLVLGDKSLGQVTTDVCRPLEGKPTLLWWAALLASSSMLAVGAVAVTYERFASSPCAGTDQGRLG